MESTISLSYTHIYAHTPTSAWNVVGASAPKRMENGVREGKGGRGKGGGQGEGDQWKEYEWKGERREIAE